MIASGGHNCEDLGHPIKNGACTACEKTPAQLIEQAEWDGHTRTVVMRLYTGPGPGAFNDIELDPRVEKLRPLLGRILAFPRLGSAGDFVGNQARRILAVLDEGEE